MLTLQCKVQNSVCTPLDTDCELVTVKLEVIMEWIFDANKSRQTCIN